MTPHDLLDRIHQDREALAALWCGLTQEQMIRRPGPQEDWSVKDLVAHITWWESFILERVTDLINGAISEPAEHQDVLNARAYEQHKDSPLTEVLAAFDANWPKLEAFISSLNSEQLNTPAYYRTYDGVALLPILRAGTFLDKTPPVKGALEATTSGLNLLKKHRLPFPVFDWNSIPLKDRLENRFHVGDGVWPAFSHVTGLGLFGRRVLVVGYGPVGKGIAERARNLGAIAHVTDLNPVRLLEARHHGCETVSLDCACLAAAKRAAPDRHTGRKVACKDCVRCW